MKIINKKKNDNIFNVNRRISIIIPNRKDNKVYDIYSSRIEDFKDDEMELAAPTSKGVPVFLSKGEKFIGRMPADDSIYEFTCSYIDKRFRDNILLWTTSHPYDIKRIQLRDHFRYEITMSIKVRIVKEKEEFEKPSEENGDQEGKNGEIETLKTKDISAGGVKIVSKVPYLIGEILELTFDIPDFGTIVTIGKVLRIEMPQPSIPLYCNAIQFLDIVEKERKAISKFIFKKQLEERSKKK